MSKVENINLNDYELHSINSIHNVVCDEDMYDIEVEEDNSFFIVDNKTEELILSHNCDGILIRGLLNTLFYKFTPNLIKSGRICFLQTPLITGFKNKKVVKLFFNFKDYSDFISSKEAKTVDEYQYSKGLGSFQKEVLKSIFDTCGLENFIVKFEYDKDAGESINNWMSKDTSDIRKEFLRGKEFDMEKV